MGQQSEIAKPAEQEEEFTDLFEYAGTPGTDSQALAGTPGTQNNRDAGQPGHVDVDPVDVLTFISTAEAGKTAGVDSRTIRRWYEQKKVRGQFSKGRLLIAKEDLLSVATDGDICTPGLSGADPKEPPRTAGTLDGEEPGRTGQTADAPQSPAIVFGDFLDRIERLSRENGELRILLEEQRKENQQLKLLTDIRHKKGSWLRFWSWFTGQ